MIRKTRREFTKILSLILAVALMLTMLPGGVLTAKADDIGLSITPSNGGTYQKTVNGSNTVITLLTDGNYTISGSATDTEIVAQYSIQANITLKDVSITGFSNSDPGNSSAAIFLTSSYLNPANPPDHPEHALFTNVTLMLAGSNKLVGGNGHAGVEVPQNGANLTIKDSGLDSQNAGSLESDGTGGGAGIGGGYSSNSTDAGVSNGCGTVTIISGIVTAKGSTNYGYGGAGIGGGYYGDGGTVTILGGTVTAAGGELAAGIGGGTRINFDGGTHYGGDGGTVTIRGGRINATGGNGGTGIGGGSSGDGGQNSYGGKGADVTIWGGTVIAMAGNPYSSIYGYGIGAGVARSLGTSGSAGSYNIIGGSVYVKGSNGIDFDAAPKKGTQSVYLTTVRIPSISAPTTVDSCPDYNLSGSQTDSSGYLYLYLQAGSNNVGITMNGKTYQYNGTVQTTGSNMLKMEPNNYVNNQTWWYQTANPMSFPYDGKPISAKSDVSNAVFYYSGTDYTTSVPYGSNVAPANSGTYHLHVTSAGDDYYYPIDITTDISITPKSISGCTLTFSNAQAIYKYSGGDPVDPSFTVSDGGVTLQSYDYTAQYTNNTQIAASTDTPSPMVTLTGKGNYTGSLSGSYTIEKSPEVMVSADPTNWTNGSVTLKADVTVGSSGIGSVTITKASDPTHPQTLTGGNTLPSGAIEYSYSAVQNDTINFMVTDGAGYTASKSITVSNIDSTNPVVGIVSDNPTTPAQSANLTFPASAVSGIKSITVSRKSESNTWEQVTGAAVTQIKNQDGSYTCSYHTTDNGSYKFTVTSGSGLTADTAPVNVTQIDLAQPIVNVSGISGSTSYASGNWAYQDVMVTLSNSNTSNLGMTSYEYSTNNGGTWSPVSGSSLTVTNEGTSTYIFRATSQSGVVSNTTAFTVKLDKTAPTSLSINFANSPFKSVLHFLTFGLFFGDTVNVTFFSNDNVSSIDHYEYQMVAESGAFNPNNTWQTGSATSVQPDFKGTIYARAVDKAGNVSGYVAKSLVVDKTAPIITANGGASSLSTIDKNASIPITVVDNGAGIGIITYQVNGSTTQTVELTLETYNNLTKTYNFNIGSLPDGYYDVIINAQDNSGNNAQTVVVNVNKDTSPKVNDVTVTPGSISLNHGGTQQFNASVIGTNNPSTLVKWSVTGNKSNGTTVDTEGKLTVAPDESAKTLTVTAVSVADPKKYAHATITVNISNQSGFGFSYSTLDKIYGDAPFTILAAGGQGCGNVTYAVSSGSDIVSVDTQSGKVTIKKVGNAVITATKVADGSFNQTMAELTLHINKAKPLIKTLPKSTQLISSGPLSSSTLFGGTASVPGTFVWAEPSTAVKKSGSYEVAFLPTDTTNYMTCACTIPVTVSQQITDSSTNVAVDLSDCSLPNGITSLTLSSSSQTPTSGGFAYAVVVKLIGDNQTLGNLKKVTVYDLSLLDQNGKPVENFTGKIKVKIPIPEGVSGDLHIFWYNTDNGTLTDMRAIRENNYMVFETSHFSFYAIASFGSVTPGENPKTGTQGRPLLPLALLGVCSAGTVGLEVVRRRRKAAEGKQR